MINIDISKKILETKRTILRIFNYEDLNDFYDYASIDGVGERAGWVHHKNKEESLEILKLFINEKKDFAIILKENKKVIGSIGLKYLNEDEQHSNTIEIGYVLSKQYWNLGLMTEVVSEVIKFCFKELNLDFIFANYFNYNESSKRVLEKNNFIYYGKKLIKTRYGTLEEATVMIRKNNFKINKKV